MCCVVIEIKLPQIIFCEDKAWCVIVEIKSFRFSFVRLNVMCDGWNNVPQIIFLLEPNLMKPLDAYSGLVSGVGTERIKVKLLKPILAWFPKCVQKESKLSSWGLFWLGFRSGSWGIFWLGFQSGHRNDQNEAPDDSDLDPEMTTERIKVELLRPILAWFQEWTQKGWKWTSWGLFWPGSRSASRKNQN